MKWYEYLIITLMLLAVVIVAADQDSKLIVRILELEKTPEYRQANIAECFNEIGRLERKVEVLQSQADSISDLVVMFDRFMTEVYNERR